MEKLNRIKIVLVENGNTGKWLARQLGKSICIVGKWTRNTKYRLDLFELDGKTA